MSESAITFIVPGQRSASRSSTELASSDPGLNWSISASVRVAGVRAGSDTHELSAVPGRDAVALYLVDGPTLILSPENARDLMLAQESSANVGAQRSGPSLTRGAASERASSSDPNTVAVPASFAWSGLTPAPTRGVLSSVTKAVLSHIEILTDLVRPHVAEWTAQAIAGLTDSQVVEGVYQLEAGTLETLKGSDRLRDHIPAGDGPVLVFIHGTFSTTEGTFKKLWSKHPGMVSQLFERYRSQVFALDHATLGSSPIANALTLARAAAKNTVFHLVTHSRGGLVAEVLSRVCANPHVSETELGQFFSKEGQQVQREQLSQLVQLVASNNLKVARVVRVACPARGTLLASNRLDAYVSVLRWALQLAQVPVAGGLVEFLGAVAKERTKPDVLPGLEAMMPNSGLVRWLHETTLSAEDELRVVAGDIQADSVRSWLKTLVADSFYRSDNDLVVNTSSMYGGVARERKASFLLDAGGEVSHFNYFSNERTARGIVDGLLLDNPTGYQAIGPLSYAGEESDGVRAQRARVGAPDSSRPAVFVLPGILGSHLKQDGDRVWLSYRIAGGLSRLRYTGQQDAIEPDGPLGVFYDRLIDFLGETHEVIPFGFDWRKPIEQEARRLAAAVTVALDARARSGNPVRIVAHSMGGILARVLQLECDDVWRRMLAGEGARVLMLGTPNAGSWAPMQVLSGDDRFGDLLVTVGAPFNEHATRQMLAEMPGFIQLQAGLLDPAYQLGQESTWQKLAKDDIERVRLRSWWHRLALELEFYHWGVPPQAVLDQAVALRQRLDRQRDAGFGTTDKLLLVVGQARFTPNGYECGANGLSYRNSIEGGDGRVTFEHAYLPNIKTWSLAASHSDLPDSGGAFGAYLELLTRGTTARLTAVAPGAARSGGTSTALTPEARYVLSRPARTSMSTGVGSDIRSVLANAGALDEMALERQEPLRITVQNGNLKFIRQTLLIGHYQSSRLTGVEAVIDPLIGGSMSSALSLGSYPSDPNTQRVFANVETPSDNPWSTPRPGAVVVVGLGQEGQLQTKDLISTVTCGVIAWAQRLREDDTDATSFELAATLIGSGGVGRSAGSSARAIAHGVRAANERLAAENQRLGRARWPTVSHLILVELYQDRASEAWRALRIDEGMDRDLFLLRSDIEVGAGPLLRTIESDYRGADYDLISATAEMGDNCGDAISFRVDSRRARTEISAQATQLKLVKQLVSAASSDTNRDPQVGATLFQLLVPLEIEPFLTSTGSMLLEVDATTAAIPWEILNSPATAQTKEPWAIRTQLIRKLRTPDFRARVMDARPEDHILVIGGPNTPANYAPLPGAVREAQGVAQTFESALPGKVTALTNNDDAMSVINALFARSYRVVHVAGHGEPGTAGGVVLSNDTFLGPREIESMRTVPELVFVNCCFLAARDLRSGSEKPPLDRVSFAATVADALINIGVRCVVAAGWAVSDDSATRFATVFYKALLTGSPFREAVTEARKAIYSSQDNTWAAYQCYGDPDWRWSNAVTIRPDATRTDEPEVATATGLKLLLERCMSNLRYDNEPVARYHARVTELEKRYGSLWGGLGDVAELFGLAFAEARDSEAAIRWYARAVQDNQGRASQRASDQLANLQARSAYDKVAAAAKQKDSQLLADAVGDARAKIQLALQALSSLIDLQKTEERQNFLGSAYKRLALVERAADQSSPEARHATEQMANAYKLAQDLAGGEGAPFYYPGLNYLAATLVLNMDNPNWSGFVAADVKRIHTSSEDEVNTKPNFWNVAARTELAQYEAVAARKLAERLDDLLGEYADLHSRVSTPLYWASIRDTAAFVLEHPSVQREQPEAARLLEVLSRYAAGTTS